MPAEIRSIQTKDNPYSNLIISQTPPADTSKIWIDISSIPFGSPYEIEALYINSAPWPYTTNNYVVINVPSTSGDGFKVNDNFYIYGYGLSARTKYGSDRCPIKSYSENLGWVAYR